MSMTVEELRRRKNELGYTYEQVAELSGVPLGTVQKVFAGVTKAPRYDTLRALEGLLKEPTQIMREAGVLYGGKKPGEYTLDDYYALPEDKRVELIDGVFFEMLAPTSIHQLIGSEIWNRIRTHIKKKKGNCIPFLAPTDVQLDCDDKTMVEPDVLVVCDRSKIVKKCIYGAPDFVVEILSPTTKKKDSFIKLNKYMEAGVREYWVIDPDKKKIVVYDFENDEYPTIYGFDAKVPVNIFGGECVVDFAEIYEYVEFLY